LGWGRRLDGRRKAFGSECGFIFFYRAGGRAFLQGFLEKSRCGEWCFDGEVVVECVVNVVN
jgi:hypothetical protein